MPIENSVKGPVSEKVSGAAPNYAGRQLLNDFIQALPNLREALPQSLRLQLEALKTEGDEELLIQELLAVGANLKSSHRIEAAHLLLSGLAQAEIPAALRSRARAEADAIEGKGSTGLRAEFLLSRFSHDATDPRVIAPMLAATLVGQLAGTAALGRFAASPSSWLTRGFGARLGAGTLGYSAEVATFAGLSRALSPHPNGPFSHDLARAALTIGVLKFSGTVAKATLGQPSTAMAAFRHSESALPFFVHQSSAFMGLAASHKLEEQLGLRPRVEGSTFLLDTFSALVSLGVGAQLGRRALGERFAQFQGELGLRTQGQPLRLPEISPSKLVPAYALGETSAPGPLLMANMGNPGSGGGGRKFGTSYQESDLPEHEGKSVSITPQSIPPRPPLLLEAATDPHVGMVVDGRYHIIRQLGFGGMGVVYEAAHQIIGKRVALKVLRPEHLSIPGVGDRFLNEAKAASSIGNPHIIDITDFGRLPDGSPYFVMEFLEGVPLDHLVSGGKPAAVPRLLHIARQAVEGLAAAHRKGIVHRDLKPDNIFLIDRGTEKDFTKVLDFGIAKLSSNGGKKLTVAGDVFGTPQYMSPEQAAGNQDAVDHRSDIYSFGIILYELATGKVPFDSENAMSILTAQMYTPVTPIHELVPLPQEIPPGLEAVIMKCLSKRPELRYQSMEELGKALDEVRVGLIPAAVAEMKERPLSADIPVDYFKSGGTPPGILRHRSRWPLYAGVGIGGASILAAAFYSLSRTVANPQLPVDGPKTDDKPKPDAAPVISKPVVTSIKKTVDITVDPADAHVFLDGKDLGSNIVRLEVELEGQVEVEIRREGYKTKSLTVDASKEALSVQLEKQPKPNGSGKPRPYPPPSAGSGKKPNTKPSNSGEVISPWK